jgi:hypothetical protein
MLTKLVQNQQNGVDVSKTLEKRQTDKWPQNGLSLQVERTEILVV